MNFTNTKYKIKKKGKRKNKVARLTNFTIECCETQLFGAKFSPKPVQLSFPAVWISLLLIPQLMDLQEHYAIKRKSYFDILCNLLFYYLVQ